MREGEPDDDGVSETESRPLDTGQSDGERLEESSLLVGDIVGQSVKPSSRVKVVSGEGSLQERASHGAVSWWVRSRRILEEGEIRKTNVVRRSREEDDIRASVVSTDLAELARTAGNAGLDGDSVSDLPFGHTGSDLVDLSRWLVTGSTLQRPEGGWALDGTDDGPEDAEAGNLPRLGQPWCLQSSRASRSGHQIYVMKSWSQLLLLRSPANRTQRKGGSSSSPANAGSSDSDDDLAGTSAGLGLLNQVNLLLVVVEASVVGGLVSGDFLVVGEDSERGVLEDGGRGVRRVLLGSSGHVGHVGQ
jgi:hypothetical protein